MQILFNCLPYDLGITCETQNNTDNITLRNKTKKETIFSDAAEINNTYLHLI